MKGYIIPFGSRRLVSINKKIDMQIRVLSEVAEMNETDVEVSIDNNWETFKHIVRYGSLKVDYSKALEDIVDPDFIFIRHAGADRQFVRFLKTIKTKYPNCKIIDEIPTYPYMKEWLKAKSSWLLLPAELWNRRYLKKYIDKVVSYYDYQNIYGIDTIVTMNGIEVDRYLPVVSPCTDTIRMTAVAYLQYYDGYERIIEAMHEYYKNGGKRKVIFNIVGDGPEECKYRELIEEYNLADRVYLKGKMIGKELEDIYENTDIGVEVFGLYKRHSEVACSLKSREYLVHGIPIISGCYIDVFQKHPFEYFFKFPNDSSVFNLQDVIDFYDRIFVRNRAEIAQEIHAYAKEYVDVKKVYKPLLDYLTSSEGE